LDGTFDLDGFTHVAFYNEELGRIEMHLKSLHDRTALVAGVPFRFKAGETIHTENSYKYSVEDFRKLAHGAGWSADITWTDDEDLFSIHLMIRRG
jgi:uncharacterized SAM-dependent methyltransferase